MFIAIKYDPQLIVKDQLDMDKEGYLTTKPDLQKQYTWHIWQRDVKDKVFRQVVTVLEWGAWPSEKIFIALKIKCQKSITYWY